MSSSESDEIVVGVDGRSADTTARAKRSHSSGGTAMDNFRIPTSPDGTLTAPGAQQLFHKARLGECSILGHHLTTEEKSQIRPGDVRHLQLLPSSPSTLSCSPLPSSLSLFFPFFFLFFRFFFLSVVFGLPSL